jgi:hypothetical protein
MCVLCVRYAFNALDLKTYSSHTAAVAQVPSGSSVPIGTGGLRADRSHRTRWLTALSVCSCSRLHYHLQPCSLLLAHSAIGVLMLSMAFSYSHMQPCSLLLAHSATDMLT